MQPVTNPEPGGDLQRRTIRGAELEDCLSDPDLTIVDVRPLAAFNGWRLNGEDRGGHIPGAVAFPSAWLERIEAAEIRRLLEEKRITSDRKVVVYGEGREADTFAANLRDRGIERVRVYDEGFKAWAADASRPIDRLPKHEKLVHIGWLRRVLRGERPEAAPTGPVSIIISTGDQLVVVLRNGTEIGRARAVVAQQPHDRVRAV